MQGLRCPISERSAVDLPFITDPFFYAIAVPAVLLLGISKSGFGAGLGSLAVPLMALAVTVPDLAEPADLCAVMTGKQAPAYDAFVSHLLYAAEQMLDQSPEWEPQLRRDLEPHLIYICAYQQDFLTDGALDRLLVRIVAEDCPDAPKCA